MLRQKTFCGYPIDNSQLLFAFVHLAPTRDVEAGEMYSIGKGGYGLAEKPVKAGETAAFMIAGNIMVECADGVEFYDGESAAYDPKTHLLVKSGTPGALDFFTVEMYCPCDDSNHRPFAMVFFDQDIKK